MNVNQRRFLAIMASVDPNWMEWSKGKFIAINAHLDLLGVEADLGTLTKKISESSSYKKGVVFAKVGDGKITEVPAGHMVIPK